MACHTRRVRFPVPGCFANQPGKVCCSFPFPPSGFFSCLFILTVCLGSRAATRSSQGGLQSAAHGGGGFGPWLLCEQPVVFPVHRARGRGLQARFLFPGCFAKQPGVFSVLPRSAGAFVGPWLLWEFATGVYGVPRSPGAVFSFLSHFHCT